MGQPIITRLEVGIMIMVNSAMKFLQHHRPLNHLIVMFELQGYGDNQAEQLELLNFMAMEGATNRLLNITPLAGYASRKRRARLELQQMALLFIRAGYPLWWSGAGIPTLTYDMGALYPIDTLIYVGYSPNVDPRQTKFKLWVSPDNVNWTKQIIDYSANTTVQPEAGFSFPVT